MNLMKMCGKLQKDILILALINGFLFAEPSAFELQSGATKKDISSLQSSSKNLQTITTDVQARLGNVEQIQDGLKSLLEGQNLKIKQLSDDNGVLKDQLSTLQAQMELQKEQNKENSEVMDLLKVQILSQQDEIRKLQESLKDINDVMVKNNEMLLQQLDILSKNIAKDRKILEDKSNTIDGTGVSQEGVSQEEEEALQKDPVMVFQDAKSSLRSKNYDQARKSLEILVKKKYKLAEVYFMLGDISYSKKEYQTAVSYYKKSFTLDEGANYMPVLLWRTAWSFRYLKDAKNYDRFTEILVKHYPNSEQAQKILEMREKKNKG